MRGDGYEVCRKCGGAKKAPDNVSVTLHCECPLFPYQEDWETENWLDEEAGAMPRYRGEDEEL